MYVNLVKHILDGKIMLVAFLMKLKMKTLGYNNYDGGTDYDNSIEDGLTIIDMKHIQFQDDGDASTCIL